MDIRTDAGTRVDTDAEAYLERIGATRPAAVDLAALRELQARHLDSVPFENLSIHLGEPISLAPEALLDKIVHRRRGGFCYELNGAFGWLLDRLGFRVTLLAARMFTEDGVPGPPFDHLALRVDLDEPWLVDVGSGRFARHPLRLGDPASQSDPTGGYRLAAVPDGSGDLDVHRDGGPVYRLEPRPRELADFRPTCWWQATSPESHFTRQPTCSLPTRTGRITLSGDRLISTEGTERGERTLSGQREILAAYRAHFGIELSRLPGSGPRTAQ